MLKTLVNQRLFEALYSIGSNLEVKVYHSYILIAINVIQQISLLNIYENSVFGIELPESFIDIFNIFMPFKRWAGENLRAVLISLGIICGIYIFYVGVLVFTIYSGSWRFLLKFYGKSLRFFEMVLFLPITGYLLNIAIVSDVGPQYANIPIKITAGCFIVIAILLKIMIKFTLTNYKLNVKDTLASNSSRNIIMCEIGLLGLLVLYSLLSDSAKIKVLPIGLSLISLSSLIILIIEAPYKCYSVLIVSIYCSFLLFWTSILFSICDNIDWSLIKDNFLVAWLLGLFMNALTLYRWSHLLAERKVGVNIQELSNDFDLHNKIRYFTELISAAKKDKSEEMKLTALVQCHIQSCINQSCICKNRLAVSDESLGQSSARNLVMSRDHYFIKGVTLVFLHEGKEKFKNSKLFLFTEIIVYLDMLGNVPTATALLQRFTSRFKEKMSYLDQYSAFCLNKQIKSLIEISHKHKNKGTIAFEKVKLYDLQITQLR